MLKPWGTRHTLTHTGHTPQPLRLPFSWASHPPMVLNWNGAALYVPWLCRNLKKIAERRLTLTSTMTWWRVRGRVDRPPADNAERDKQQLTAKYTARKDSLLTRSDMPAGTSGSGSGSGSDSTIIATTRRPSPISSYSCSTVRVPAHTGSPLFRCCSAGLLLAKRALLVSGGPQRAQRWASKRGFARSLAAAATRAQTPAIVFCPGATDMLLRLTQSLCTARAARCPRCPQNRRHWAGRTIARRARRAVRPVCRPRVVGLGQCVGSTGTARPMRR